MSTPPLRVPGSDAGSAQGARASSERQGLRLGTGTLRFRFDGRVYLAREGDTVVSALLAQGVRALGRSMKTRRLRGAFAAGAGEPNALVTLGRDGARIPNVCGARLVLREGMELSSQNRWPHLHADLASLLPTGGGLFSAGFYYKTFRWPSWHFYEPIIRRLAGLGAAPTRCELPPVGAQHEHCDVLVVGGGPAGICAALAAARAGARVVLCEREPALGGELEFETADIDGQSAAQWLRGAGAELARLGVRVLTDTALVGGEDGELVAIHEPGGLPAGGTLWHLHAGATVLACGASEQTIAFVDNDLPGVMLLGAAERLLARHGVAAGRELVLFGAHDRLYAAAPRLLAGGMRIRAIVDPRPAAHIDADEGTRALRARLAAQGVQCLAGHTVLAARGRGRVRSALLAPCEDAGRSHGMACDAILVSGGWAPEIHAGLQGGGRVQWEQGGGFVATGLPAGRLPAGAAQGRFELGAAMADGHRAGAQAAAHAARRNPASGAGTSPGTEGTDSHAGPAPTARGDAAARAHPHWRSPATERLEHRQFLDPQNDVTVADLRQALAEGFCDIEHVKRYTTLGMGTEQGRCCSLTAAGVFAELRGVGIDAVGLSRRRPPFQGAPLQSLTTWRRGTAFRPARRTPLHDWHEQHGGVLDPMGLWLRPRWYRDNGPDAARAAIAEARRVRADGGIVDASTLGKIEFCGPDAGALLDHAYLSRVSTLKPGRAKYSMAMREDGMVLDDGIVLRIAPDRFVVTTSSSHAEHMLSHFEHLAATHAGMRRVAIADVTEAWAVLGVAGPRSRDALSQALGPAWHQPLAQLAPMGWSGGQYQGQELRVLRAGYSGELAFELHCRPGIALALWQALLDLGLAPYGIDALDILRLEKGYLGGYEINGQTTPLDLGLQALVAQGNDFLGRELLARPALHEARRPHLVGVRAVDGVSRFSAGAQLTVGPQSGPPCGFITSAAWSPALGQWIGLALLSREVAQAHAHDATQGDTTADPASGTQVHAQDPLRGLCTPVQVTAPTHFDPEGARMRA